MLQGGLRLVRGRGCFRIPGRAFLQERKLREDRRIAARRQGAGMPHMFVSTQIRLETGPTNVGDEYSDPAIMNYLGARKTTMLGNNFSEYHVDDPPRLVLDKLEKIGFRVLTMTGVGQTLVWCLHKETE
ncbi:GTP cyclohydrolase 1 feedback regulatory protein isoform X2 [Clinocottus analis]|uniref:GTP cyclohydrolase 1 feedback regulatory protein isoform X2 n=2 Tax=Clinocottus analis TaxID=304258 RepID=UPI0035BEE7A0